MKLTENKIFLGIFAAIILFGLLIYVTEYGKETAPTTTSSSSTTSSSTSTSTTTSSTAPSSSSSSLSTTTTSSTSTSTTSTTLDYYRVKYSGKGYRQLFLDVAFICPSCVPATAKAFQEQDGIIAQNFGFRQRTTWIIYDPTRTTQEAVIRIMRSGADVTVLNDTMIP